MSEPIFPYWPQALSHYARSVDLLFWSFSALVLSLAAPAGVALVWFCIRYRRLNENVDREQQRHGATGLEWTWMIAPFALSLAFFFWAARLYLSAHEPPAGALEVYAIGKQWMWKFEHPNGPREINELHVPAGEPVRVVLSSQDVIHSLYLPDLRLKQDAVPGRFTDLWFSADRPGVYPLLCAEFCGTDHAAMNGRLVVMAPDDYQAWLSESGPPASGGLVGAGERLFRLYGCSGCHVGDGAVRAPALDGLFGRPTPLASGEIVVADERYLTDSILKPQSEIAAGYAPVMPSFAGVASSEDVVALVAYLKSLASSDPGNEGGDGR